MSFDFRPGDCVRLGRSGTLVVLDITEDEVQFLLEGVEVFESRRLPSGNHPTSDTRRPELLVAKDRKSVPGDARLNKEA